MVDKTKKEFRKRDIFYLVPLWLLSLIAPDPYLYHKKDFKKKDLFYLGAIGLAPLIWSDTHFHHLMVLAGIYAILALGLSLFMGYAGQIFLVIVRESTDLTGGVIGIFGIPWFSVMGFSFDTYLKQYYLTWGVLIGLFIFSKNLVRSKVGRALLAVAASEDAASSVGIHVPRMKLEILF